MLAAYKNKYIAEINQWRNDNSRYPSHKIYELLWAIEKEQILWSDIPPGFEDTYNLPHRNDYGIDLIDLQYSQTSQVKFYGETSLIKWSEITNYTSYSKDILGIQKLNLLTTPVAKIDKMVQRLFVNNPEFIQRNTLEDLLEKIPRDIILEDDFKCSHIEPRPYLVSTANSIIESIKFPIKVQWPCGAGKAYLALYLFTKIQETLKEGEVCLFITPWRSLGRQVLQDCVFLGINAGMIGDGKRVLEKSWKFVICLSASIHRLPKDLKVSYKFGDEGHHFENGEKRAVEFNNIVADRTILLSATFHNSDDVDYIMTKREAIDAGIITDYKIHLQYYTGGRSDAILKMVKENSDWIPMFIYFNTTEKAKNFCKLLRENHILADYLTGQDGEEKRARIKEQITNGLLVVVCLCGVWNEGESIHILRTVIFGDLRHSSINIRQVAQRGSRKHPSKPFYNIVLPIEKVEREDDSEDDSDSESGEDSMTYIQKIIKIFSDEDTIIKKSIQNRSYTRFNIRFNNEIVKETGNESEESTLLYKEVFNSLGEMVEENKISNRIDKWVENLENLKDYFILNKSRPVLRSKNEEEKRLGKWLQLQITRSRPDKRSRIMKDDYIFRTWTEFTSSEEFKKYFLTNKQEWTDKLERVKNFMRVENNRPSQGSGKEGKKLAKWLSHQLEDSKIDARKHIMLEDDIFNLWMEFISSDEFGKYFLTDKQRWKLNLEEAKRYIREVKKPCEKSKDSEEKRLGMWISHQLSMSKNKRVFIMLEDDIFNLWLEFISSDEFSKYFLSRKEQWIVKLEKLKKFIVKYQRKPFQKGNIKDLDEKQIGHWLGTQIANSKPTNRKESMKDDDIFQLWKEFVLSPDFCLHFPLQQTLHK